MEAAFVGRVAAATPSCAAGEVRPDAAGWHALPAALEAASSGDPVPVQVTKDPIGQGKARLTSQTSVGRYLVLIPGGSMMGISRKLPDKRCA